ncbi:MAG: mandelate racemase/muconate lactonizing enzyme family protein [Acetobacteraceae bacterium]|nr:mandelate racemase/muconate lactonizing enzyme family protein [Acetobacteraceae bacterium]
MRELCIDRIEIRVVEPEAERLAWSEGMHGQFMSNTVVRVFSADGLEGVAGGSSCTGFGFDRSIAETAKLVAPLYLGRSAHERVGLWHETRNLNVPASPIAAAVLDVALWDLAAKAADMPLHAFLGGARHQVPAYASTPLYLSDEAYVNEVGQLFAAGFEAIKLHCWCNPARDLPMCERLAAAYPGRTFMLDVEQRYGREPARRVAKRLGELGFLWFEAPLLDFDLQGYAELRAGAPGVDILPAGNWLIDRHQIAQGIAGGAWDRVRTDVFSCGGITPARDILALARAHNMPIEVQCWGFSLSQAANLHLILSTPNATYFEQPVPYAPFEYGVHTPIRLGTDSMVAPPPGPGLGMELDWDALDRATGVRFEVRP